MGFAFSRLGGEQAHRRQRVPQARASTSASRTPVPARHWAQVSLRSCWKLGRDAGHLLYSLQIALLRLPAALLTANETPLIPRLWQ